MLWNEEASIGPVIDSLFKQTLIAKSITGVDGVDLAVLANGCTDESIPNAHAALDRNLVDCHVPYVSTRVIELPKGRQPTWNKFIHHLTPVDTEYIFCMDADIVIADPKALENMLFGLEANPGQHVATADGIKHIELFDRRSLWQTLTLEMTRMFHDARSYRVNGQLYCGRVNFFRSIEFPKGFVCGDDGFIGMMAISNLMTTESELDRICYLDRPTYVYEAYLSPSRLFRQHRRRMVGAITNAMIRDYVTAKQVDHKPDAGVILRRECKENPEWFNNCVAEQIRQRGFWVAPFRGVKYRFTQLRGLSIRKKILRFPLACAGAIWSLGLIIAANQMFRSGTYNGAWENVPNSEALDSLLSGTSSGKLPRASIDEKH